MFISLGVDCGTATILKELGLRERSLPFDWILTYEGIANIINNNFDNFLPSYDNNYEQLNINYGVVFVHNRFPDDTEKMNKRIDRFKHLLETSDEKITFVRKSHGNHHHNEYNNIINDVDDAINLDLLLLKKYPNLKYEIHVILLCDKCFTNVINTEDVSDNVKLHNISIHPYTTNPDYSFNELCKHIFKKM